ncbi:hypothetical protein BDQ12DRAFT_409093 [Crucibulum laeve]|uniref:Secreted protein n=1 Tax=Crucibulum laeve TaxID=68775 RepID=A0A5C3LKV3_9AGAR|nr:hypothetical protein BDQ12DRAFT_409093 [Crucibulum laeve]
MCRHHISSQLRHQYHTCCLILILVQVGSSLRDYFQHCTSSTRVSSVEMSVHPRGRSTTRRIHLATSQLLLYLSFRVYAAPLIYHPPRRFRSEYRQSSYGVSYPFNQPQP